MIAAGNDKLWHEVANAIGMAELADDPRFITQAKRAQNQQELVALLAPRFKSRPAAEWLDEMDRRQVPCAPINDFADILHDPPWHIWGWSKHWNCQMAQSQKPLGFQFLSAELIIQISSPPRPLELTIKPFTMSG